MPVVVPVHLEVANRLDGVLDRRQVGSERHGELLRRRLAPARQHDDLFRRLARLNLVGGMVYDALVGEAARVGGHTLMTRDRRALRTYEAVGVRVEFVS